MAEEKQRALPPPDSYLPAVPERPYNVPSYAYAESEEDDAVPLSHYLWILKRHRWKILAFVLTSVLATVIVSSRLTPIYESTATVDIDRQAPSAAIGEESTTRSAPTDADQFLATQVKLVESDSVLRPVVDKLKIPASDIETRDPRTKVSTSRAEDAPIVLKRLKVTRPPNTYLLLISYRSPDPQFAADVSNGIADSYIQHTYDLRFRAAANLSTYMEKQLEQLKAKMETSSAALAQFEKELNVINPEDKTNILSARLLELNSDYTKAQADRVQKEAAYNAVKDGSLPAAQASSQGEQLQKLSERMDEAQEKFAAIKAQYGVNHPEYKKAASRLAELRTQFSDLQKNIGARVEVEYQEALNRETMLNKAVTETKAEYDGLNARSFQYKALKEEADSDKQLYEQLIRKVREAGINASFENSSIRLADSARPALKPSFPNLKLNGLLAFLFSSILAIGAAILSDTLDHTVRDPEQIQRGLKTQVIGSLPVVKSWRGRLPGLSKSGSNGALVPVGNGSGQASAYEEAVRTLRDSILLSDLDHRPRSLLMTSATPREGKTTTSVHLAVAHSQQRRKTLLVDADLRRPGVHGRLGVSNDSGLSNVVNGEAEWRDALQKSEMYPDLDVLTAGPASRSAADRVGAVLERLLREAAKDYDLVILDAPPLLGFAEPLQMAAIVDGVVVVTLAGQTNKNAVASVLNSLKRLKANVIGVALNEVREDMSNRYYYYGYYGKYYSRYYKPTDN